MEYPADEAVRNLDDEYFFGKDLLVCPLTLEDGTSREVYLPAGIWYNFFTGEKIEGGKNIIMQADWNEMLVFAREGVVILLAKPNLSITKDIVFEITIKKFGKSGSCELYEDDAIAASGILGIATAERVDGQGKGVKELRFSFRDLDVYLPKLIRAGNRVAVCEPNQTGSGKRV